MKHRQAKSAKPARPAKKPSAGQRWQAWWAARRSNPLQREVFGCLLLLLAALTVLGLSRVPSGALLRAWANALRGLLGWGAYPLALIFGLLGLRLVWRDMDRWVNLGPARWIGLELMLLVLLVASDAPLVLSTGADGALKAAQQGRAGGIVGWALAVPLVDGLGPLLGSLVLLIGFLVALGLLLSVSWLDARRWVQTAGRGIRAAIARWQMSRQGAPVAPALPERPWWEQTADGTRGRAKPVAGPQRSPVGTVTGSRTSAKPIRAKPRPAHLPPLDLLEPPSPHVYGDADVRRKSQVIEETLVSFGVPARVVEVRQGPTVTQFGLDPGYVERRGPNGQSQLQRVRVGRISSLVKDLSLALASSPLRIEAPVPGRPLVGVEVPNETVSLVSLRAVIASQEFRRIGSALAIALGEDVAGKPIAVDLGSMPHLLVAGATGSGKSVCINAVICCLLLNNSPDNLKMLMVDPKMVELVGYNGIPHLVSPVVVDVEEVVNALAWVTRQMDERYTLLHEAGVRNLSQFNEWARRTRKGDPLPTVVVLIDELADMMMVAPDEVERHLCRVAQMGRATGIHLVVATQRPSVDVVTGLIKANFPARISFAVTSLVDSRVILDQGGAENLLGRGDMLFVAPHLAAPLRVQGSYVSDAEIERLAGFWRTQEPQEETVPPWADFEEGDVADELLQDAIQLVSGRRRVSTSFVQRNLRIGFPRAARLMDQLEEQGIVGPDEGGGKGRQVLVESQTDVDDVEEEW